MTTASTVARRHGPQGRNARRRTRGKGNPEPIRNLHMGIWRDLTDTQKKRMSRRVPYYSDIYPGFQHEPPRKTEISGAWRGRHHNAD